MWLLIAAIVLLLFIWVFGEIADRIPEKPEKHDAKRHAVKRR